jgi:hypothetical protein
MTGDAMRDTVLAALFLAAVSTFGDFLWAALALPHRVAYGVIHGAVICLCIGAAIGQRNHRLLAGALAGPVIGILAASSFYLLAPVLRWRAMLPAWMLFWLCFAFLQGQLARQRNVSAILARGAAAAVLSGAAFYAIAGIWTRPSPGGPDYVRHFFSWTAAFLPGFAALFLGRRAAAGDAEIEFRAPTAR